MKFAKKTLALILSILLITSCFATLGVMVSAEEPWDSKTPTENNDALFNYYLGIMTFVDSMNADEGFFNYPDTPEFLAQLDDFDDFVSDVWGSTDTPDDLKVNLALARDILAQITPKQPVEGYIAALRDFYLANLRGATVNGGTPAQDGEYAAILDELITNTYALLGNYWLADYSPYDDGPFSWGPFDDDFEYYQDEYEASNIEDRIQALIDSGYLEAPEPPTPTVWDPEWEAFYDAIEALRSPDPYSEDYVAADFEGTHWADYFDALNNAVEYFNDKLLDDEVFTAPDATEAGEMAALLSLLEAAEKQSLLKLDKDAAFDLFNEIMDLYTDDDNVLTEEGEKYTQAVVDELEAALLAVIMSIIENPRCTRAELADVIIADGDPDADPDLSLHAIHNAWVIANTPVGDTIDWDTYFDKLAEEVTDNLKDDLRFYEAGAELDAFEEIYGIACDLKAIFGLGAGDPDYDAWVLENGEFNQANVDAFLLEVIAAFNELELIVFPWDEFFDALGNAFDYFEENEDEASALSKAKFIDEYEKLSDYYDKYNDGELFPEGFDDELQATIDLIGSLEILDFDDYKAALKAIQDILGDPLKYDSGLIAALEADLTDVVEAFDDFKVLTLEDDKDILWQADINKITAALEAIDLPAELDWDAYNAIIEKIEDLNPDLYLADDKWDTLQNLYETWKGLPADDTAYLQSNIDLVTGWLEGAYEALNSKLIISVTPDQDPPDYIINKDIVLTVITTEKVKILKIFNEADKGIYQLNSTWYVNDDGFKVWEVTIQIGTAGLNRMLKVYPCDDFGAYLPNKELLENYREDVYLNLYKKDLPPKPLAPSYFSGVTDKHEVETGEVITLTIDSEGIGSFKLINKDDNDAEIDLTVVTAPSLTERLESTYTFTLDTAGTYENLYVTDGTNEWQLSTIVVTDPPEPPEPEEAKALSITKLDGDKITYKINEAIPFEIVTSNTVKNIRIASIAEDAALNSGTALGKEMVKVDGQTSNPYVNADGNLVWTINVYFGTAGNPRCLGITVCGENGNFDPALNPAGEGYYKLVVNKK